MFSLKYQTTIMVAIKIALKIVNFL